MKYLIAMTSITYAVKAQRYLNSHGIKCSVVTTPKNIGSGCGYSLSVEGVPQTALTLLEQAGIRHKGIISGNT